MTDAQPRFHLKASLALIFAVVCWSSMPLFLRAFIHELDGWVTNGVRYPFSAVLWSIPLIHFYRRGLVKPAFFRLAIVPSIVNTMSQIFWSWTPYFLEPGKLMFLAQTSIIFSLFSSFLLFREERVLMRSKVFWTGLLVCICGFVGINVLRGNLPTHITWMGLIVIIGHGMFSGFYAVSVRNYMRGIAAWYSFPIICIYTSAVLCLIMFLIGDMAPLMNVTAPRWGLLAASSVIGIAISHVAFYYAIEHLGVSICVSCCLVMPLLTSIGSHLIYGEVFSPGQMLSGAVLLTGAGMLIRTQLYLGNSRLPMPTTDIAEVEAVSSVEGEAAVNNWNGNRSV